MPAVIAAPWIIAVLLWLHLDPEHALGNPAVLVGLAALQVGARYIGLNFEIRRHSFTMTLIEIPFVASLFLLPPLGVLVVVLAGTGSEPLLRLARGNYRVKDLFNLGLGVLEAGVALVVVQALGDRPISDPLSWAIAIVAIAFADLAAGVMVLLAISTAQGRIGWRQVAAMLIPAVVLGALNSIVGLVALIVLSVSNWGFVLLLAVVTVVVIGYRAYNRFLRQHKGLGQVYEFSSLVEKARGDLSAFDDALQQLRETFNATTVVFTVEASANRERAALLADESGVREISPCDEADPLRERLTSIREGILLSRKGAERTVLRDALDSRGVEEILAVPLRLSTGLIGFLEVHDRQGEVASFTQDDLQLLHNLAAHLTAALENQQLVDRLTHDAHHDRLTGLPNRERFTLSVDEAIASLRAEPAQVRPGVGPAQGPLVAVCLLDLDSFKDVNESLGHDYGDRLLITVGERLRNHFGGHAMVARMGADEFAVLSSVPDLLAAEQQAAALHKMLAEPYQLAGLSVHVGSCVGIAVAPDHALDGGTLLQRADVALYAAKSKGRTIATYLPTMEQASVHRLQLVTQLREALDAGQVTVRYQPKIAMATRELVGVEALVRWEHPQYGTVVPDDFVPLAERTGLIAPLTLHVIGEALRQCRAWLDRDLRIGVAVNLSVRNLLDTDFPDRVEEMRSEMGVPADLLAFEITESSVMSDPERSMPVLHRLHELGIGLSIDDFGTGYSSLAYLRRLPVDEVKIDKVFVLGMGTDLGDLAIVRAIIELGHSLGLRVVAEGVEDELARDLLEGMDCDVAQGFLVSRALAPDRLDAWFTARTVTRPGQPGVRGRRLLVTG